MIVQAFPDKFIMIAQDDHAAISGSMATMWKDSHFRQYHKRSSVEYAVTKHDLGWKHFDEAPFWNDVKSAPYTFIDYPTSAKTVLYRHGIEVVERKDNYAALLCSRHYSRFLQQNVSEVAQKFVAEEKLRRETLIQNMDRFDQDSYDFHYGILQMLDDMSLFICLNEPGVSDENIHPFFKNEIRKHEGITAIPEEKIRIYWKDEHTICLYPFPFTEIFTVTLRQRTVMKTTIEQDGLLDSYQNAPMETIDITLAPHSELRF